MIDVTLENEKNFKIDTGDIIYHRPTGESWVVAYAIEEDDILSPAGWPYCEGRISDCRLLEKATDFERLEFLVELSCMPDTTDRRQRYASAEIDKIIDYEIDTCISIEREFNQLGENLKEVSVGLVNLIAERLADGPIAHSRRVADKLLRLMDMISKRRDG